MVALFFTSASGIYAFRYVRVPDNGACLTGSYVCKVTISLGFQNAGNEDLKREVRV